MASSPPCNFHPDTEAIFIGTFFETGQSVTVCTECLLGFCASIIANAPGDNEPEDDEPTEPTSEESTSSDPTPDDEPESSASPASFPDATDGDEEPADRPLIPEGATPHLRLAAPSDDTADSQPAD